MLDNAHLTTAEKVVAAHLVLLRVREMPQEQSYEELSFSVGIASSTIMRTVQGFREKGVVTMVRRHKKPSRYPVSNPFTEYYGGELVAAQYEWIYIKRCFSDRHTGGLIKKGKEGKGTNTRL